jgi:hypothetical protein
MSGIDPRFHAVMLRRLHAAEAACHVAGQRARRAEAERDALADVVAAIRSIAQQAPDRAVWPQAILAVIDASVGAEAASASA